MKIITTTINCNKKKMRMMNKINKTKKMMMRIMKMKIVKRKVKMEKRKKQLFPKNLSTEKECISNIFIYLNKQI